MSEEFAIQEQLKGVKAKDRLPKALELWRNLMVTFDGRNKQLYYRNLKTGDVDFKDKHLNRLVLQDLILGKTVLVSQMYPKLFEGAKKVRTDVDSSLALVDQENQVEDETDYFKLWTGRLKKYEAVYRKAKENFDEKNIETCFIAESFATWDNNKPGPIANAPIILHPIKIEPTARGNADFKLQLSGDPFFNQALSLMFQKEFGLDAKLFDFSGVETNLSMIDLQSVLSELKAKVKGFNLKEEFLLGNFSFQKYPMVIDMQRIMESGYEHELLLAISGDYQAIASVSEQGSEESLWELSNLNPMLENLIFPADSTQHQAISAIVGGKSVVIQGPPGSGKSQTIANVIAEAVAHNKKILFVAEKRAAIDAVVDRLGSKGLKGVVLDLHGDPDKKTIAQDLLAVVKAHNFPQELSNANTKRLVDAKKELNERWFWMNSSSEITSISGEDLSYHQLLVELGELRGLLNEEHFAMVEPNLWKLQKISADKRDEIAGVLSSLHISRYFNTDFREKNLLDLMTNIQTEDDLQEFTAALETFKETLNSTYWRKRHSEIEEAFNSQVSTRSEVDKCLKSLKTYRDACAVFDMNNFAIVSANKSALLTSKSFRTQNSLGLVRGYFAKKKMSELLATNFKNPGEKSNTEILKIIESQEVLLAVINRSSAARTAFDKILGDLEKIEEYASGLSKSLKTLNKFMEDMDDDFSKNFDEALEQLRFFEGIDKELELIPSIRFLLAQIETYRLSPVLEKLTGSGLTLEELVPFWNYSWLTCNLVSGTKKAKNLTLDPVKLDADMKIFAELDGLHLQGNTGKILKKLADNVHQLPPADRSLLVKESLKKGGHLPFRKLLQQIPESILKLKPVMAMSPLAVSQILPCKQNLFDIVIFDEASQIKPHDAIAAIFRGKQLVVAGDRFQLPPTSFGEKSIEDDLVDEDDINFVDSATTGMESILTTAVAVFNHNVKPLGLHYRSNDERLISWSNFHIYRKAGEELFTFPSRAISASETLRYTYLPDVRIQSMSVPNESEIQAVKAAVLEHIEKHPEMTLGIIAFGMRHSIRLQDEFNILEKENDNFYNWKSSWSDKQNQFFIKNIERVQGDERDAIIITPGYGPNLDGSVPLQFGSLNRQGGERRLNVAASRAKDYMHLITSMKSSDIELGRTKSSSIGLLRSYLEFMENRGRLVEAEHGFNTSTTPFESEIQRALETRGLQVDCQVGDSGFKIDFAIKDPKTNEYILAIEADGATYHSTEYARERDYMRQRILENRGWRFVRIWSTDWWRDPESQIQRVLLALDKKTMRETAMPKVVVQEDDSELIQNQEYLIFRGIVAKNPNGSDSDILTEWMAVLGKQRVTDKLSERFWEYWEEAKRTL